MLLFRQKQRLQKLSKKIDKISLQQSILTLEQSAKLQNLIKCYH